MRGREADPGSDVPDFATFLCLCAGAGLLGLDATAALQIMLSRPLVVGTVMGWVLGSPEQGLAVGGLIELLWVGGLPVGSLVPPDGTVAATVAAAVAVSLMGAAQHPGAADAAGALGVLLAVPAGWLGARAEILQRHLASGIARRCERAVRAGRADSVTVFLAAALGLAWLRGFLATALALLLLLPLAAWLLAHLPADAVLALRWCFWLFWLLGLAVVADHFWDRRSLKYAAAVLLGLAVLGTRPWAHAWTVLFALALAAHILGLWRWDRARKGKTAP
jgi:mannose/fructose/N-acetylgalactosamine-specific phosphotransferase system component IIC